MQSVNICKENQNLILDYLGFYYLCQADAWGIRLNKSTKIEMQSFNKSLK